MYAVVNSRGEYVTGTRKGNYGCDPRLPPKTFVRRNEADRFAAQCLEWWPGNPPITTVQTYTVVEYDDPRVAAFRTRSY